MLNLVELEREWLKYKIKTYIPIITIALSTLIIISITFFLSSHKSESTTQKQEHTQLIQKEKIKKIETPQQIKEPKEEKSVKTQIDKPIVVNKVLLQSEKRTELSPSLDFMKRMQNSIQPYYQNESYQNKDTQPIQRKQEKETTQSSEPIEETSTEESEVSTHINITRQNRKNDIYEIITRFKKNNNPALSLFIAKKYYELGDYRQAYNYSLITNEINKDIESSWIIFAKSLVKLGKKEKALSILEKYIQHSHSSSAKILYDEINSGKFQ